MAVDFLEPNLDLLCKEYVLVQAWKKASSFIRYHNWYSDTLELDRATVNLPSFLADLADRLRPPERWINDALRIVPAPKPYRWRVVQSSNRTLWQPVEKGLTLAKLRPLAHVTLKDQVAATALMLCLANRVETLQGDPRVSIERAENRRSIISYGNRLFCEKAGAALRHPWGSAKLYRAYYEDYKNFLARPAIVAGSIAPVNGSRVVIVRSDLRQFYDRVRPSLLKVRLSGLMRQTDDPRFFAVADQLLNWAWHTKDSKAVAEHAEQAELPDFSRVALPQGLVAAGFFANIALLEFDEKLRENLTQEIKPGIRLEDVCRYVDDLRIVATVHPDRNLREIEQFISEWLQELLNDSAPGLQPSVDKTRAAVFEADERPLVQQSRKMARIQNAISAGFDAIAGKEILDAVQGLITSQRRYSEERTKDQNWRFSPVPDVRDETVARFAAGRFRNTYRSLRPLLETIVPGSRGMTNENEVATSSVAQTQAELDSDARAFALGLVESWVEDPSNVRLLRIGLDLWPAADVLRGILDLLRPFTEKGRQRKASRLVAWYCLAEIFRAGATETGFVEDQECLPSDIDLSAYHAVLRKEALRLAKKSPSQIPWYLRQQVFLFLAVDHTKDDSITSTEISPEISRYLELIQFLDGRHRRLSSADFAILAILTRRSFGITKGTVELILGEINPAILEQIAERDPSLALEIVASKGDLTDRIMPRLRNDLSLNLQPELDGWLSLAQAVLQGKPKGTLRNELTLLRFAARFLVTLASTESGEVITPSDVLLKLTTEGDTAVPSGVEDVKIVPNRIAPASSMYRPPSWCPVDERWRFQLGYLLRFVLSAHPDFTKVIRKTHWKENVAVYKQPDSHWYQRLYGLFNGQAAFGDDWLPISDWTEKLLLSLLRWPGCRGPESFEWVWQGIEETRIKIELRVRELSALRGPSTGVLMLPMTAPWPKKPTSARPLRACIVQTVIPSGDDFNPADLSFSASSIRKMHRNHLSAALAAIIRMLNLRETHTHREGRLDWLILPELSVHPLDVKRHLVPFVRAHKTIVVAGLTYEELFTREPLINSALWVIPVWSAAHGLQVVTRRQGKCYLSPEEEKFNATSAALQGFRPCQWLIGYEWSNQQQDPLLKLTSSICYDATDLRLAADLRQRSDVFAILALNRDVNTFDQMALALHYHMFQMVIVTNNGRYGGSNAYIPHKESYIRQVFHLHGQPQASVAFLEIDDVGAFIARQENAKSAMAAAGATVAPAKWKFPPAGM